MRTSRQLMFLTGAVMGASILAAQAEPFQGPGKNSRPRDAVEIYSQSLEDRQMKLLTQAASSLDKRINDASKRDPLLAPYMLVALEGEGYQIKHPIARQDSTSLVFGGVNSVPGFAGRLLPGEFAQWANIASTKAKTILEDSFPKSDNILGAVVSTDGLVIPINKDGKIRYDLALTLNHPEVSPVPSVLEVVKNLREGRTSEPPVGDNSAYLQLRQIFEHLNEPKPLPRVRLKPIERLDETQESRGHDNDTRSLDPDSLKVTSGRSPE